MGLPSSVPGVHAYRQYSTERASRWRTGRLKGTGRRRARAA